MKPVQLRNDVLANAAPRLLESVKLIFYTMLRKKNARAMQTQSADTNPQKRRQVFYQILPLNELPVQYLGSLSKTVQFNHEHLHDRHFGFRKRRSACKELPNYLNKVFNL